MKRTMIRQSTAPGKLCPAPAWDAAHCQSQEWNQTPLNLSITDALFNHYGTGHLRRTIVQGWDTIFSVRRHAAACVKTPPNRPPKQVLRQGAACVKTPPNRPPKQVLRQGAACFKTPPNRPPKQGLRQGAACYNRWWLVRKAPAPRTTPLNNSVPSLDGGRGGGSPVTLPAPKRNSG